eukprot:scaffold251642_cov32-Tisochrysis_lutea.AAC.1
MSRISSAASASPAREAAFIALKGTRGQRDYKQNIARSSLVDLMAQNIFKQAPFRPRQASAHSLVRQGGGVSSTSHTLPKSIHPDIASGAPSSSIGLMLLPHHKKARQAQWPHCAHVGRAASPATPSHRGEPTPSTKWEAALWQA